MCFQGRFCAEGTPHSFAIAVEVAGGESIRTHGFKAPISLGPLVRAQSTWQLGQYVLASLILKGRPLGGGLWPRSVVLGGVARKLFDKPERSIEVSCICDLACISKGVNRVIDCTVFHMFWCVTTTCTLQSRGAINHTQRSLLLLVDHNAHCEVS